MLFQEDFLEKRDTNPRVLVVTGRIAGVSVIGQGVGALIIGVQLPSNMSATFFSCHFVVAIEEESIPPHGAEIFVKVIVGALQGLAELERMHWASTGLTLVKNNTTSVRRFIVVTDPIMSHHLDPSSSNNIELVTCWLVRVSGEKTLLG